VSVVKAEKIIVSPQTYRVVRSFMDSSLRETHPWNVGVDFGEQIVFYKPSKWTLTVSKNSGSVSLYTLEGNLAARLTRSSIKVEYWEREFESVEELKPYQVYNDIVPNAVPLSVYVLAVKMMYYRDLALRRVA
jgi:hypothetical protein